jgi:single-strand DNA-binding protein
MLNSVNLMGRICNDLEIKHTTSNFAVCSFQIAVERNYCKQGQERETDFITIVTWRNTAEFVTKHFRKGNMIAVEGSIQTRNYTDSQGNKRTAFEILVDNVFFCESKKPDPVSDLVNNAKAAGIDTNYVDSTQGDFSVVPGDDDLPFRL